MTSPTVFLDERFMLRPEYETRNYDLATDSRTMDFPASGIKIAGTPMTASAAELNKLDGLSASATELDYVDVTTLGTVQASKAMTVASTKGLVWTTTSGTTWNPFSMTNTMTNAGDTGGRMYVEMTSAVVLGGWANAIKAYTNFTGGGGVTGLGSALVAELKLGTAAAGHYAPLESEMVMDSGGSVGGGVSFLYCNIAGTGAGDLNASMNLFELGTGISIDTGDMVQTVGAGSVNPGFSIRCMIAGTTYCIPMSTTQAMT